MKETITEKLQHTYNSNRANGWDTERYKEYQNQLCLYNGETLTLCALSTRFRRRGIDQPTAEAKKYLKNNNPIEFYDVYP